MLKLFTHGFLFKTIGKYSLMFLISQLTLWQVNFHTEADQVIGTLTFSFVLPGKECHCTDATLGVSIFWKLSFFQDCWF